MMAASSTAWNDDDALTGFSPSSDTALPAGAMVAVLESSAACLGATTPCKSTTMSLRHRISSPSPIKALTAAMAAQSAAGGSACSFVWSPDVPEHSAYTNHEKAPFQSPVHLSRRQTRTVDGTGVVDTTSGWAGCQHLSPLFQLPEHSPIQLSPDFDRDADTNPALSPQEDWRSFEVCVDRDNATWVGATLVGETSAGVPRLMIAESNVEMQIAWESIAWMQTDGLIFEHTSCGKLDSSKLGAEALLRKLMTCNDDPDWNDIFKLMTVAGHTDEAHKAEQLWLEMCKRLPPGSLPASSAEPRFWSTPDRRVDIHDDNGWSSSGIIQQDPNGNSLAGYCMIMKDSGETFSIRLPDERIRLSTFLPPSADVHTIPYIADAVRMAHDVTLVLLDEEDSATKHCSLHDLVLLVRGRHEGRQDSTASASSSIDEDANEMISRLHPSEVVHRVQMPQISETSATVLTLAGVTKVLREGRGTNYDRMRLSKYDQDLLTAMSPGGTNKQQMRHLSRRPMELNMRIITEEEMMPQAPPQPVAAAAVFEYEVERVLEERKGHGGEAEFRVKWKNFVEETWDPLVNFNGSDWIDSFRRYGAAGKPRDANGSVLKTQETAMTQQLQLQPESVVNAGKDSYATAGAYPGRLRMSVQRLDPSHEAAGPQHGSGANRYGTVPLLSSSGNSVTFSDVPSVQSIPASTPKMVDEYEQLADDSSTRITIWDTENSRKIAGKAAPTKGNLSAYFQKYPQREVYTNQQKQKVSSPSPAKKRPHPTPIKSPASVPKKQQKVSKAGGASPRTPVDRSGHGPLSLPTQPTPVETPMKTPAAVPKLAQEGNCKRCKRGAGVCFHIGSAGHLKEKLVEVAIFAPGSGGATVKWSDEELNRLKVAMAAAGKSGLLGGVDWEQVSKQVGRTPSACSTRSLRLGLKPGDKSTKCSSGGRWF